MSLIVPKGFDNVSVMLSDPVVLLFLSFITFLDPSSLDGLKLSLVSVEIF